MISGYSNWTASAQSGSLLPVQKFTIYNADGSVLITLTRERATDPPVSDSHWINALSGGGTSGDILSGNATNSELTVGVLDAGKALTRLLMTTTLEGLTARLSTGFPSLAAADYLPAGTYIINAVKSDKSNLRYVLSARDPGLKLQNLIYLQGDDGWPTSDSHQVTVEGDPMALLAEIFETECGYAAAQLNTTAAAAYQADLFSGVNLRFTLKQSPQAMALLQQEVFAPLAGYAFWNAEGKYTPYYPLPVDAVTPAMSLTTRNIKSPVPTFDAGPFVGSLCSMLDYDGSNFLGAVIREYGPAIAAYGLPEMTTLQSKGLRSANGGVLLSSLAQQSIFRRHGMKPRLLRVRCLWETMPLEIGDVVSVTHPLIPDRATGQGLLDHWYEVTGKEIDWDKLECTFNLLDVNWLNATALQIAPNGTAAWGAASAAEKAEYGFVDQGQLVY